MANPELRLVTDRAPAPRAQGAAWPLPVVMFGLLVTAATIATAWGADGARHPLQARNLAASALEQALERGSDDAEVRRSLLDVRRYLALHPLDSKIRVVYASMLLGLTQRLEDSAAAVFHARRAAELAPVTVPVVRPAALVMAHAGEAGQALDLVRGMFEYSPGAAAETLARIEPLLLNATVDAGIPDDPDAWMAWYSELQANARTEEADRRLQATYRRWPDHLPALERLAASAAARQDWDALERLLPPDRQLPEGPDAVRPRLYRAKLAAARGDVGAAREEVARALAMGRQSPTHRILAGEVYLATGDLEQARREWNRALFALSANQPSARGSVLLRLARLEDRRGRASAALRLWQEVLELDPDQAEARRRVDDLAGFER